MEVEEADAQFLTEQIVSGNVILFLGAGINNDATNGHRRPIKNGSQLELMLQEKTLNNDADASLGDLGCELINASQIS